MTFAYGTPIAVGADAVRAVQAIAIDDVILATGPGLAWSPSTVTFSAGRPPGEGGSAVIVIFIAFGDGQMLIVTPDQLFLGDGGKLARADQLVPGRDRLVRADGEREPVLAVRMGEFTGGVWSLALEDHGRPVGLDGHLINAGGIVAGDYALQIADPAAIGVEERPTLGTPAYASTLEHEAIGAASEQVSIDR